MIFTTNTQRPFHFPINKENLILLILKKNFDYVPFNKSGILNKLKKPQTQVFLETLTLRGLLFYKVFIQRSDTFDIEQIQHPYTKG